MRAAVCCLHLFALCVFRLVSAATTDVMVLCLSSQGKCFPCGHTECPLMGHHADRFTGTEDTSIIKYFLTTGSKAPFRREYLVPLPRKLLNQISDVLKFLFFDMV